MWIGKMLRKRVTWNGAVIAFALMCVCLVSCGTTEAEKTNTVLENIEKEVTFTDRDPGRDLPEYNGVWQTGKEGNCLLYVASVTENGENRQRSRERNMETYFAIAIMIIRLKSISPRVEVFKIWHCI